MLTTIIRTAEALRHSLRYLKVTFTLPADQQSKQSTANLLDDWILLLSGEDFPEVVGMMLEPMSGLQVADLGMFPVGVVSRLAGLAQLKELSGEITCGEGSLEQCKKAVQDFKRRRPDVTTDKLQTRTGRDIEESGPSWWSSSAEMYSFAE